MTEKTVLFRTTCGPEVGFGHLRRCLTLAEALAECGVRSMFLLAPGAGTAPGQRLAEAAGFAAKAAPDAGTAAALVELEHAGARCLVADDYGWGAEEFRELGVARRLGLVVGVLDDLAERELPVDWVLNAAANADEARYRLLAPAAQLCLGPSFVLLRRELRGLGRTSVLQEARRAVVTLGGSDALGWTAQTVAASRRLVPEIELDAVLGPFATSPEADADGVRWHRAPAHFVELLRAADVAICAGGQTSCELAALGVPTVGLQVAENQRELVASLSNAGTLVRATNPEYAARALAELAAAPERREAMRQAGLRLIDGQGATRAAQSLSALV